MKNALIALALTGLAGTGAAQAQLTRDQFAYGLDIEARQGVVRMLVPLHVEQNTGRADLGDLRVFNAQGEIVPHTVEPAAAKHTTLEARFPLERQRAGEASSERLRIATHSGDASVTIEKDGGPAVPAKAYLVSTGRDAKTVFRALRLVWEPVSEPFSARIDIAVSDDLSAWRPLGSRFSVGQVRSAEGWDRRDRLALPGQAARYLRITLEEGAPVELSEAVIEFDDREPPVTHWADFEAVDYNPASGAAIYDTLGRIPVELIDIEYAPAVYALYGSLEARRDKSEKWRRVGLKAFYRMGDGAPHNKPYPARHSGRYWRLTLKSQEGEPPAGAPRLKIGWRARELVFFAEQSGVYRVGYGLDRLEAPAREVQAVVASAARKLETGATSRGSDTGSLEPVTSAPLTVRGDVSLSANDRSLWRKGLLWVILFASVGILFVMARRLMGEMAATNDGAAASPPEPHRSETDAG